jgi:hypothetical protein
MTAEEFSSLIDAEERRLAAQRLAAERFMRDGS